jgi:hypothetical protein
MCTHLDAEQLVLALVVDDAVDLAAHHNVNASLCVERPAAVPAHTKQEQRITHNADERASSDAAACTRDGSGREGVPSSKPSCITACQHV